MNADEQRQELADLLGTRELLFVPTTKQIVGIMLLNPDATPSPTVPTRIHLDRQVYNFLDSVVPVHLFRAGLRRRWPHNTPKKGAAVKFCDVPCFIKTIDGGGLMLVPESRLEQYKTAMVSARLEEVSCDLSRDKLILLTDLLCEDMDIDRSKVPVLNGIAEYS